MKDFGDVSFILGIKMHRDRSRGIIGFSQKRYIDKVLARFDMTDCAQINNPVAKGETFSLT